MSDSTPRIGLTGLAVMGQNLARNIAHHGFPISAFSSLLAYYDGYRRAVLQAKLIKAQRDLFGAHTDERNDKPGKLHSAWGPGAK